MKLAQIIEARYYRQPTLKQIEKRLQELSHETKRDDIYVYDQAVVNNSVHADFYVYGIEEHDDVVEAIKRFLIKQGIPFTKIWNVINTTYRNTGFKYTATMTYNPKIPVTEARYYGKHSLNAVVRRYWEANETNPQRADDVSVSDAYHSDVDQAAYAILFVHNTNTKKEAFDKIEQFLKRFGIPHTDMTADSYGNSWEARVTYNPDNLVEARYYGKPSARDVTSRLKMLSKVVSTGDVVMVDDAWQKGKSVEAAFTIYNTEEMEDVLYKVKHWLNDNNIPYTEIKNLFDFSSGAETFWSATMVYNEA